MPLYEYYCSPCAAQLELLRPMLCADDSATCPEGHRGGPRMLSVFARVSREGPAVDFAPTPSGGGCACGGGGCGCGH